ncbi:MAG: protein kinase, partial [Planctomycetales bacterium]
YALYRVHAEGGLGKIWLARDEQLNREVALKELKPESARRGPARTRFVKEAQVTGQLEHPSIVPVYDLAHCEETGNPFYTMRFVRGPTLRDAVADYHKQETSEEADPLARPRLLNAFVSVCQAVGYAHSRGVVHRDLKPDNVVLGDFGEVLVLDWGLAKMVDDGEDDSSPGVAVSKEARTDETAAGRIMGTPAYMAPEQASGRLDLIDGRTDIYGLGAVLFEILTGRPPHQGANAAEVLTRIVEGDSPSPVAAEPSVPAGLAAVCEKAMAHAAADRYAKASELAEDVQRWMADEPVTVHQDTRPQQVARWMRKHRSWTQAGAAALMLVTFVSMAAVVLVNRAFESERRQRYLAESAQSDEFSQRRAAQDAQKKAENSQQTAEQARKNVERAHGNAEDARRNAETARRKAESLAEENNSQLVRWHEGNGGRFMEQGDLSGALLWFTEGLRVHRGDPLREQRLRRRVATVLRQCPRLQQVWFHSGKVDARFSPDGTKVLTACDDMTARVWDVADGQPLIPALKVFAAGARSRVNEVVFSSDGKLVLAVTEGKGLWVWDAETGKQIAGPFSSETSRAIFSPDNRHVLAFTPGDVARVWDARTGLSVTGPLSHEDKFQSAPGVVSASFHPSGKQVLTLGKNGTIRLWSLENGSEVSLPFLHRSRLSHALFDPDGRRILTGDRQRGTVRFWDARTGKAATPDMASTGGELSKVVFGTDGTKLLTVYKTGVARVWDARTGQPLSEPLPHDGLPLTHAILSPDGRRLLTARDQGAFWIWDLNSSRRVERSVEGRGPFVGIDFSPDGQRFLTALEDGTTHLWSVREGDPISPPLHHGGPTTRASFSPDGRTVLTSGADGAAKMWTLPAPPRFAPVARPGVATLFSRDGSLACVVGEDGAARTWRIDSGELVAGPISPPGEI